MLKKILAFGLLAAGTIGLAVPAHAQNVVSDSQSINAQTVGVKGSKVLLSDDQAQANVKRVGHTLLDRSIDNDQDQTHVKRVGHTLLDRCSTKCPSSHRQWYCEYPYYYDYLAGFKSILSLHLSKGAIHLASFFCFFWIFVFVACQPWRTRILGVTCAHKCKKTSVEFPKWSAGIGWADTLWN